MPDNYGPPDPNDPLVRALMSATSAPQGDVTGVPSSAQPQPSQTPLPPSAVSLASDGEDYMPNAPVSAQGQAAAAGASPETLAAYAAQAGGAPPGFIPAGEEDQVPQPAYSDWNYQFLPNGPQGTGAYPEGIADAFLRALEQQKQGPGVVATPGVSV